jgi:pyridoxal phosphate enzyme (YggS family)
VIRADEVAPRLALVRERIEHAGGDPAAVGVVAVTKGFGPDAIDAAVEAGCTMIGENYAQELLPKLAAATVPLPTVHFIGRLQSNKVRALAGHIDVWESVDRASLVDEIARRCPGAVVFVQVNVSEEPHKGGCEPADTASLVARARSSGLDVRGLMAVGRTGGPDAARAGFRQLRLLADELGIRDRSMGMSEDLDVAVQEGATLVRVGTALFGMRSAGGAPGQ